MDVRIPEQLDKILALADSTHEAEAVVAVRKARQMLSQGGLSFGDLARAASGRQSQNAFAKSPKMFSFLSGQRDHLESHIHYLRQQLEDLREQMRTQDLHLDFWRRRAADLEGAAQTSRSEALHWQTVAREAAAHSWDNGQGPTPVPTKTQP